MYVHRKRKLPLVLTIFIMAFIFLQSALPADLSQQESNAIVLLLGKWLHTDPETLSFVVRKCAHFTEYMALGMSVDASVREYQSIPHISPSAKIGILSWGIGTLYAVTDEVHQRFVPGRSCELRDMLIDSCGVAVGVLLMAVIRQLKNRTTQD